MGLCVGIGHCVGHDSNIGAGSSCPKPADEFLKNWTFECGLDSWDFDPAYPATITDNGDGSVHLQADSNFGSLVPNEDTFPSATWVLECKVRNVVGNGKLSFRRPNGTWVTNTTYNTDGTFSAQFTGAIAEIHVGANGDDTFEADYDYISLKHYVPFNIKIWSPTAPTVKDVAGGAIMVTNNNDGTFQLTSTDYITTFKMDSNKADITKVEIITEELTSLRYTFLSCSSMTEFIASSTAFSKVTNFRQAWDGCSGLTSFPLIDTSEGIDFEGAWGGCMGLINFPLLDTSKVTNFVRAWSGCKSLTSFPKLDTSQGTGFSYTWNMCTKLKCMQRVDTTLATDVNNMFADCTALCRPNASEQTQIAQIPGINWETNVPDGEDCCTWTPPPVGVTFLGEQVQHNGEDVTA